MTDRATLEALLARALIAACIKARMEALGE